jgi:protein-disulfide isomerase
MSKESSKKSNKPKDVVHEKKEVKSEAKESHSAPKKAEKNTEEFSSNSLFGKTYYLFLIIFILHFFFSTYLFFKINALEKGGTRMAAGTAPAADAGAVAPPVEEKAIAKPTTKERWRGPKDARYVMVEYSDHECPFCKTIHPDLKKIVGENKDVAWVFRDFPLSFHPKAQKTGEAAVCAGMISNNPLQNVLGGSDGFYSESATDASGGFWKMSDAIFDRMPNLELAQLPDLASELGYDRKAFEDCLNGGKAEKTVKDAQAEGTKAGIQATPTTVIYDMKTGKTRTIEGALPYESIKSTLEDLRKQG